MKLLPIFHRTDCLAEGIRIDVLSVCWTFVGEITDWIDVLLFTGSHETAGWIRMEYSPPTPLCF